MPGILPDVHFQDLGMHLHNLMYSPYVHIFFWLMWVDIITGYIKAFKTKKFDSRVGTWGLLRHVLVLATILIIGMYSRALGVRPVGIAWCSFFIFNYIGSFIENWEAIGIGFPDFLRPYINQMKKQNDTKVAGILKVNTIEVKEKSDDNNERDSSVR